MIRQRENQKNPFPRVKGGYCGHGLGSLVICRHLLSVSWRLLTMSGLNIPCPAMPGIVPGVSSRAIMLPNNTVQSMDLDYVGKLSWAAMSYGAAVGNSVPILYFLAGMEKQKPAGFLAGCKTCRYKPDIVPAYEAATHGLWRMVFHPADMNQVNLKKADGEVLSYASFHRGNSDKRRTPGPGCCPCEGTGGQHPGTGAFESCHG